MHTPGHAQQRPRLLGVDRENLAERVGCVGVVVLGEEQLADANLGLEVRGVGLRSLVVNAQRIAAELKVSLAEVLPSCCDSLQLFG